MVVVVEEDAVEIKQVSEQSHGVVLDLVYATANNIAGVPIYQRPICLLHRDAAHALHTASALARQAGLRLKVFDAFRPHEAQVMLWNSAPDKAYVADPALGSNHTRGVAVDLTLLDAQGAELDMGHWLCRHRRSCRTTSESTSRPGRRSTGPE